MKGDVFNVLYLSIHSMASIFSPYFPCFPVHLPIFPSYQSSMCFPGTFPQLGSQQRAQPQSCQDAQPFTRTQAGASSGEGRLFPGETDIKPKLVFSLRTAATFLRMLWSPNLDYSGWLKTESCSSLNILVPYVLCPL